MTDLSPCELFQKFPDERATIKWLEEKRWPNGDRCCIHCGSLDLFHDVRNASPMPYRCRDCGKNFSLRTGTCMEHSKIPLQKWVIAGFLLLSRPKGISSVQLGKDLGIQQRSAWFLGHRLRLGI